MPPVHPLSALYIAIVPYNDDFKTIIHLKLPPKRIRKVQKLVDLISAFICILNRPDFIKAMTIKL